MPDCAILIFSAFEAVRGEPAALAAGADRYLEKKAGEPIRVRVEDLSARAAADAGAAAAGIGLPAVAGSLRSGVVVIGCGRSMRAGGSAR